MRRLLPKRRTRDAELIPHLIRSIEKMTAATERLATSITNLGGDVQGVADAIRNHPATQADDSGQLNQFADQLDTMGATLKDAAVEINGPAAGSGDGGAGTTGVAGAAAGDAQATPGSDPAAQPGA